MEYSSQNDSDVVQDEPTPAVDKPVARKSLPQKPLFIVAVLGISFAGWYGWNHKHDIQAFCLNTSVAQQERETEKLKILSGVSFNTEGLMLPENEIINGGVSKDGIPALTTPDFVGVADATSMRSDDRIAGVVIEGQARAYPIKIMNMHEVVNDKIGNTLFAVTYCPLCDSLAVYNRKGTGGTLEFGVSGFLYNSNVLLYDRSRTSGMDGLWSQMMSQGVGGPRVNEKLSTIPVELTTWEDWIQRYPETQVVSTDTGHQRDYSKNPYAFYLADNMALIFTVNQQNDRLPSKIPLLGVWVGEKRRAYPVTAFTGLKEPYALEQELDGKKFTLVYHPKANSLRVVNPDKDVKWMYSFWFAWYAFYPDTELYTISGTARTAGVETESAAETNQSNVSSEKKQP